MHGTPRIFVQIPCYRDPDCQWTIKDMFDQARHPERIFVGVFWQIVPELDQDCFVERPRPAQVREQAIHARDSLGYSWACAQVEKLWQGEEYTMRIDSHMRFEPGWDEALIETLAACPTPRAVLTTFPMGFTPPRNLQGGGAVTKVVARGFEDNGVLMSNSIINPFEKPPPLPMPTAFIAGCFYFGPSSILREVPWDPHLYFFGTEISYAVRLWTHGYDLYAPNRCILYHNYERVGRGLHWDDDRKWVAFNERSHARVRHLFGMERASDPAVLKDIDRYGFGPARTLHDYERFTDISFVNRTVSERAKSYHFPYASPEEAEAATREEKPIAGISPVAADNAPQQPSQSPRQGEGPSDPARRTIRLSTTFKGPSVPPSFVPVGRGGQRRSIERQLQEVACDLIFGAERGSLIARLVALGAPPVEAHRIIDSASNDPLIANGRAMALVLRKRDWLLDALERQQRLWPPAASIERRSKLSANEFLEHYYSRGRPVILAGEIHHWPAVYKWTSSYLAKTIGSFEVECQTDHAEGPNAAPSASGRQRMPFDQFVRMAARPELGNRGYMLADGVSLNVAVAAWLGSDLGILDSVLDRASTQSGGTIWIGSSDVLTPLHHDLVNCLVAQIAGRNRFKIMAAGDVAKLYNQHGALSDVRDLEAPEFDIARYPALASVTIYDVTLEPGEILFVPFAWWYQVRSIGFGASVTYTNFRWPNDFYRSYPQR